MNILQRAKQQSQESIVGVVNQKRKHRMQITVIAVLRTIDMALSDKRSIVAPGAYIVIKTDDLDTVNYNIGDKLRFNGNLIKQGFGRSNVYIASGEIGIQKLREGELRAIIAEDLFTSTKLHSAKNTECDTRLTADSMRHMQNNRSMETQYKQFLSIFSPEKIETELNTRIVGQSALTRAAADFLYYHALRQLKPELPPRPMLISGPSGSGKTEVWRVAKTLFGNIFNIEIIDGASMTQEGFKGENKLSSHIDEDISNGGILVIDEFDKLAKPAYESGGSNIAAKIQSEFLKLLEGEYVKKEKNRGGIARNGLLPNQSETKINTKKMGIVLVGAFEDIKERRQSRVGFNNRPIQRNGTTMITDEEYIDFGVLPELVGRVATKVTTNQLSDEEYIKIIHNPYSRVSVIANTFKDFGIDLCDSIKNDEMLDLIKRSKSNKTGVRWVSAQIESKMLETIRSLGVANIVTYTQNEERSIISDWMKKQSQSEDYDKNKANKEDEFFF